MASIPPIQSAEKSYLTSAVDSLNPWAERKTSGPETTQTENTAHKTAPTDPGDHSITHLYGRSFRMYPTDCPALRVQWYHAIDVPKRKPLWAKDAAKPANTKTSSSPKKFSAFSAADSKALESRYQKLLEASEDPDQTEGAAMGGDSSSVPVNEDFLFDVHIPQRELEPVYWLGPIYEGTYPVLLTGCTI
jgi:hypothetical protein